MVQIIKSSQNTRHTTGITSPYTHNYKHHPSNNFSLPDMSVPLSVL